MWAHNTCGPTIHVGLLYMWAYYKCGTNGPTIHGGPQWCPQYMYSRHTCTVTIYVSKLYMWAHSTCTPTIHVGLQYISCGRSRPAKFVGPQYTAYYTCGPLIHVGLHNMWGYCSSATTIQMYCRPTCIRGPHALGAHMYSRPSKTLHYSRSTY